MLGKLGYILNRLLLSCVIMLECPMGWNTNRVEHGQIIPNTWMDMHDFYSGVFHLFHINRSVNIFLLHKKKLYSVKIC